MTEGKRSKFQKFLIMTALIASGEAVFLLPFVVSRIFRPTFLSVFGITNLQLGTAFSLYGFIAMVSYFAGGPLADKFSARRLMAFALGATAIGGVVMAGIPSIATLTVLYGFWGLTTILLFWAALIRATREWGGTTNQGKAYGFLDGGRGLVAALLASISVFIFATFLPENASVASPEELKGALSRIIWIFSLLTLVVGGFVWAAVPENPVDQGIRKMSPLNLDGVREVFNLPGIWLQAVIVVCAYVGYKCTDDFSLYASDAFGYDDVAAAQIGTISFWVRPFAAVGAGLLGDHIRASRMITISFGILIAGSLCIALGVLQPGLHIQLILTIAGTSAGIYALRGVYFALLQEARVSLTFTGSAVGIVSVIGFTPDIFMGPLMGFLIDRSPGALGHQHVFGVLSVFGVIGFFASVIFRKITHQRANEMSK